MPNVPLPDTPCVRVRLGYTFGVNGEGGNRLYFKYTGGPPTAGDLTTAANAIASAWATNIAPLAPTNVTLKEVDVLDIATNTGLSAIVSVTEAGTRAGTGLVTQVAMNVEYGIARRYRGGKPRSYWPLGTESDLYSTSEWQDAFITSVQTGVGAFSAAVAALSYPSITFGQQVNLSYYQGFKNYTYPSGREKAVPTYRATALSDLIESFIPKKLLGSQRRRRAATTY